MKWRSGKSYKLFYFQTRESPAPLNIPTPTPAPERGGHVACLGGPPFFPFSHFVEGHRCSHRRGSHQCRPHCLRREFQWQAGSWARLIKNKNVHMGVVATRAPLTASQARRVKPHNGQQTLWACTTACSSAVACGGITFGN